MRALVDAAEVELLESGVAAASVRRIANRAGVNHGLVHRHFGSKTNLVAAVLDRLAGEAADAIDRDTPPNALLDPTSAFGRHLRIVARAILDGVDVRGLQSSYPAAQRLIARYRDEANLSDKNARRAAAHLMALGLGMQLFGPFVLEATGADVIPFHVPS